MHSVTRICSLLQSETSGRSRVRDKQVVTNSVPAQLKVAFSGKVLSASTGPVGHVVTKLEEIQECDITRGQLHFCVVGKCGCFSHDVKLLNFFICHFLLQYEALFFLVLFCSFLTIFRLNNFSSTQVSHLQKQTNQSVSNQHCHCCCLDLQDRVQD